MARVSNPRKTWEVRRGLYALVLGAWLLAFAPGSALAEWDVYVSGGLGISGLQTDTSGEITTLVFDDSVGGRATDTSPIIDGAIGLEIPMDEIVPREWLTDIKLPDWPVRFEMEAAGLRQYELRTYFVTDVAFSEIEATTVMWNGWIDVPLVTAWKPAQYLFGLGRQPRIRQWLEPGSLYGGFGIGFSATDIRATSNAVDASGDMNFEFAWNAGAGVNYRLTDAVDLSVGYRFVCLAGNSCMAHSKGISLDLDPANAGDQVRYDLQAHELRVQIRVEVYDFRNPWR